MSIEVALIDFPRLQEQIATRLLAEHNVNVQRVSHTDAIDRLEMFNLAMFFWPDTGGDAAERLTAIRKNHAGEKVPIVLVTSETGKQTAEKMVGKDGAIDILVTPLQPHIVSRKLINLLGIKKEPLPVKMDAAYINPFVDGTTETFKQMCGMECQRTGLSLRMDATTAGDISGVMGLSGPAEGFVSVTFKRALARKLVCRMLQINEGEETDEDIRDGVGEFMNIVAGYARAELATSSHNFNLSLPNVIVGGPHSVGQLRGTPVMVIEFSTEDEPFEIMVCLIPQQKR